MRNLENENNDSLKQFSRREALRLFSAGAVAAGGGLAFSQATAVAQGVNAADNKPTTESQGAGFYQFKVGTLECFIISDGVLNVPPHPLFAANASKTEAENALRDYFLPVNVNPIQVSALVVKTANKTVLIDTGTGNNLGPTAGKLLANLQRAGITPAEITDIAFTHAHGDHVGGHFDVAGKLIYPNARFHIAEREWETWTGKNVNLGQTQADAATSKFYIEAAQKALLPLKDRISVFKPGADIVTGVTSVAAIGHTPGHTAYLVASGSESVLHAGDFAHHIAFQLVHPEWYTAVDFEPQQAVATRKKLLDRVAADRTMLIGSHMPFPGVGHIRARNPARTSFEWVTILWQW